MSRTLTKSWTFICWSRRDKEEGGEQNSHEELDFQIAGPGEIKRREVSRTLTKSWTFICWSRRDQEEEVSRTLTKSWTFI